jgi:transcriptional regulator with XRE-family HTH domain
MLRLNVEKIRMEMSRLGLTEAELARQWGVTRQAVWDYLNRRPITLADKFADILKLDPKDLIINE